MAAEYSTVETMHPCIVKYCNVYAKDLAKHLSLNERNLPDALATPALLDPMFGNEKRIVGSGSMSKGQYFKARQNLLRKIQDILDKRICHADISHAKHAMIKDLRHRGEKNVLVT